jgi:aryl-alcohol dehydrogenase (NADP+)
MERKQLGRTGRTNSAIGLGCALFGRDIDEETSYKVMDHAVELGIDFFDTAESYGGGQSRQTRKDLFGIDDKREVTSEVSSSERIVGRWMQSRGCRDKITLCTKVGSGGSPENIARTLGGSLDRLGTDHVDIYKMHTPDTEVPIAETLAAMTEEVRAGRVNVIGCSNYSAVQIKEALDASSTGGYSRFEIAQPQYNLIFPEAEDDVLPLCAEEGLAVTPYSPMAAGFLAGEYTPDRASVPAGSRFDIIPVYVERYFTDRNFGILNRLQRKADELGVPTARLALAWVMTNPHVTAPIVGARETGHLDNAVAALNMGLDGELRAEMSAWSR